MASTSTGNIPFFVLSLVAVLFLLLVNSKIVIVNVANSINNRLGMNTSDHLHVFSDRIGKSTSLLPDYIRKADKTVNAPTTKPLFLKEVKKTTRNPQPQLSLLNQGRASQHPTRLREPTVKTMNTVIESVVEKHPFDVTYTSQGTTIRYHYLPILLRRWSGPLSITFHLKEEEAEHFNQRLKTDSFPERLSIVQYVSTNPAVYPINKLRNLAIQNTKTDHFWLTDLDMWPSKNLYEAILNLPESELEKEKLAIIVPAFEIHNSHCKSFEECTNAIDPIFPETKRALNLCIQQRKCSTFRPWDQLHDYHFREWYNQGYRQPLTPVTCFKGNTQEPYVVVKKSDSLPPFDERFVNYAYNKVQWLEHLRYRGYAYSIITDGFAVDVPHPFSALRKKFMETREQTKETLNLGVYNEFLDELRNNEKDQSVVKYCHYLCFLQTTSIANDTFNKLPLRVLREQERGQVQ